MLSRYGTNISVARTILSVLGYAFAQRRIRQMRLLFPLFFPFYSL
jgi:hypothetical protein